MNYEIRIQDPFAPDCSYLLESISEATTSARSFVGLFAFATKNGIDLLFGDDSIRTYLRKHPMKLIVGVDAVTNRAALERLLERQREYANLTCSAFWNDTSALVHPKVCYVEGRGRHTAIVGSGNLTRGGLRDNYEAYSFASGQPRAMRAAAAGWFEFLERNSAAIVPINEQVLERAEQNSPRELPRAKPARRRVHRRAVELGRDAARVLVAEIPRGGNRWQQANFDGDNMRSFFRADPESGGRRIVFLNEVHEGGALGQDEVRPCILTRSRNLRLQLGTRPGVEYPAEGRPIAVFLELKTRQFAYLVRFPGEPGYSRLNQFLGAGDDRIRRRRGTLSELADSWTDCPFSRLNDDDRETDR